MDVFFETENGDTFEIELGYWDTVLEIKLKIEKYQRIPVSKQTLVFQGNVLQDHLDIEQCNILHKSRVLVLISPSLYNPNDNNDQVLQTEQSPSPSNSIGDVIYGEDLPLTTEDVLNIRPFCPVHTDEIYVQDSPVRKNDESPPSSSTEQRIIDSHQDSTVRVQDLPQTDTFPPLDSVNEMVNTQDWSVNVGSNEYNDQVPQTYTFPPLDSVQEMVNTQDWSVMVGSYENNDQVPQTNTFPPLDSVMVNTQDWSVKVGSNEDNHQVQPQTDKFQLLDSFKEMVDFVEMRAKRRPEKYVPQQRMSVYVMPYYGEGKIGVRVAVNVDLTDPVNILRNELFQMQQRGEIQLPQDGYFFMHKNKVMNEALSFECNGVTLSDFIIEIRPIHVTRGYYP